MKRFFLTLIILAFANLAIASPFLVSDPSTEPATVDSCTIDGLPVSCALDGNDAIKIDLQSVAVGTYTVTAKFCTGGGLWCSDPSAPFVLVVPARPSKPVGIKLTK